MPQAFHRSLLFLVAFTVPIESLGSFDLLGVPFTLNKAATAGLLFYAFLIWILGFRSFPWSNKHYWGIAFAAAIAVGAVSSIAQGPPGGRATGYAFGMAISSFSYAASLTFYLLLPFVIATSRDLEWFLGGLIAGSVFAVVGGAFGAGVDELGRFSGTSENPNGLAAYLVVALPVMLGFFFARSRTVAGSTLRKALLAASMAVTVGGIVASLSRAAVVAMGGMWGFWMLRMRRLNLVYYAAPPLVLALGIVFFAPQEFGERVATLSSEGRRFDGSIQQRWIGMYWGAVAFAANPVSGVGMERSGAFTHKRDKRLPPDHAVHSVYLGLAAQFGLLGLVPFLALTISSWREYTRVWRAAQRHRGDPLLAKLGQHALFLQVASAGVIVLNLFSTGTRWKATWMLFGLSSALFLLAAKRLRELSAAAGGAAAAETGHPLATPRPFPGLAAR